MSTDDDKALMLDMYHVLAEALVDNLATKDLRTYLSASTVLVPKQEDGKYIGVTLTLNVGLTVKAVSQEEAAAAEAANEAKMAAVQQHEQNAPSSSSLN